MSGNTTNMSMSMSTSTFMGRRMLMETSSSDDLADTTTMEAKPLHESTTSNNKNNNTTHRHNITMRKEHEAAAELEQPSSSQESSTSSSGPDDSHHHRNVITADGSATNSATHSANTSSTASSGEDNNRRYRSDITMGTSVDEYRLPVPMDGHLAQQQRQLQAVVMEREQPEMTFPSFFDSSSASSSEKGDSKLPASTSEQVADEEWTKKRKNHPVGSPSSSCINNHPLKKPRRPVNTATSENGSSGSGTEGGYAGEASSSDKPSSCSSPSLSSGEERMMHKKRNISSSASSTIADYDSNDDSSSPVYESSSDEEMVLVPRNFVGTKMEIATRRKVQGRSILQTNYESAMRCAATKRRSRKMAAVPRKSLIGQDLYGKPAIMVLGCDLMAHCMTYLEPPEAHDLLTAPLSKDWRSIYTMPQDLWRVLCLTEPFRAKFDTTDGHDSDESSFPTHSGLEVKHLLGRYRLLYTSFVRCMRYLTRIKDDAINGRPPSVIGYNGGVDTLSLRANENLKTFLARARGIIVENKKKHQSDSDDESSSDGGAMGNAIGVTDDNSSIESGPWSPDVAKMPKKSKSFTKEPKLQFAHSQLTQRLLGPSKAGAAGNVNLPWSCAIYSIVNWMVAFADVEGIQTMCLKVLPFLLEDESQRTTSQRAGLTDIVLRAMVLFPNSIELHTAAFHTIVLLARPLGGREGMLFHCSMVNSSGIFHDGCQSGKNGIAVMLDSMRRFESDEVLQAMSCWSLVNIALAPSQKAVLVKLGGISVVANAMMQHPFNTEVQFRALFALINLVIPSVNLGEGEEATANLDLQEALGEINDTSEREMLDDAVGQIANLVVVAMKNFCASESILNRACLVLHNLSLTEEYHGTLLWTPNCYQMLEWCLANYRTDQILQQSAAGTLHRLQTTLAGNDDLRQRFTSALQSQQQSSLEQAHREAQLLHQQTEALQEQRS